MTRTEAALIRSWLKKEKAMFKGDQSEWARGYKRALLHVGEVVRKIQAGAVDIDELL